MDLQVPGRSSVYITDLSSVWYGLGETCNTQYGSLRLTTQAALAYGLQLDNQNQHTAWEPELLLPRVDIGIIGPPEACALAGIGHSARKRAEGMCFVASPTRNVANPALAVAVGVGNYNLDATMYSTLDEARRNYRVLGRWLHDLLITALNEGTCQWYNLLGAPELNGAEAEQSEEQKRISNEGLVRAIASQAVGFLESTFPEPRERPYWPGQLG